MKQDKTLGILDCDEIAGELRGDYVSYTKMFSDLLMPRAPKLKIRSYNLLEGLYPKDVKECDAYLVTGSKTGVYDDEPWIPVLKQFLKLAYQSFVPLVGVCFGHQMIAHSLGGHAEKSDKGWGIGAITHSQRTVADWMSPVPEYLNLLYSHQDQVTRLPPEASCLFGSEFCQYGAYWERGKLLSFQGHPEFTKDYSQRLMAIRQSRYAPGQYESALATLELETNEDRVAEWIVDFIYGRDVS